MIYISNTDTNFLIISVLEFLCKNILIRLPIIKLDVTIRIDILEYL